MYWPMLVHFCETCRYNTPVTYSPTVWKQEHICSHVSRTRRSSGNAWVRLTSGRAVRPQFDGGRYRRQEREHDEFHTA